MNVRRILNMVYGSRLSEFRKAMGKTAEEFSEVIRVNILLYLAFEKGTRPLPPEAVQRLHHKYNLNLDWFYHRVGSKVLSRKRGSAVDYGQGIKQFKELWEYVNKHTELMLAIMELVDFYIAKIAEKVEKGVEKELPIFSYDFFPIDNCMDFPGEAYWDRTGDTVPVKMADSDGMDYYEML